MTADEIKAATHLEIVVEVRELQDDVTSNDRQGKVDLHNRASIIITIIHSCDVYIHVHTFTSVWPGVRLQVRAFNH